MNRFTGKLSDEREALNRQGLESDIAELEEIERGLEAIPEEILAAYARLTGTPSAGAFRARVAGALRASRELVTAMKYQMAGPSRARLLEPLQRWRAAR